MGNKHLLTAGILALAAFEANCMLTSSKAVVVVPPTKPVNVMANHDEATHSNTAYMSTSFSTTSSGIVSTTTTTTLPYIPTINIG